jgi:hypothetical protein
MFFAGLLPSAGTALAQSAGESLQAAPPVSVSRLTWPGIVLIVILALFLCAAIAGPLIRANTRDDLDSPM